MSCFIMSHKDIKSDGVQDLIPVADKDMQAVKSNLIENCTQGKFEIHKFEVDGETQFTLAEPRGPMVHNMILPPFTTPNLNLMQKSLTGVQMRQGKYEMNDNEYSTYNRHIIFPGFTDLPPIGTGSMVQSGQWVKTTIKSVVNDQRLHPNLKLGFDKSPRAQMTLPTPPAGCKGNSAAQTYLQANRPVWVPASKQGDVLSNR